MSSFSGLRGAEQASIRDFMITCRPYFTGKVLDYGCGTQPYRDIIESEDAEYFGYDRIDLPASRASQDYGDLSFTQKWDIIVCNQVLQYVYDPLVTILDFESSLVKGGYLILTYPTHWPEIEKEDFWRFTKMGMERLLKISGFEIVAHGCRHFIEIENFILAIGYGVIARA